MTSVELLAEEVPKQVLLDGGHRPLQAAHEVVDELPCSFFAVDRLRIHISSKPELLAREGHRDPSKTQDELPSQASSSRPNIGISSTMPSRTRTNQAGTGDG